MTSKVVRCLVYLIVILGVSWASALASPEYGSVEVRVSCGSSPGGGAFVSLQTPVDENSTNSVFIALESGVDGSVTFLNIQTGAWELQVEGVYVDTLHVEDDYTTLTFVEACPFRSFLPTLIKD